MALTNVPSLETSHYKDALRFSINTGGNLLVLGQAGLGKTEMAQQVVSEMGYNAIYLNLSVLEYPDLVGLQTIVMDEKLGRKVVEYASPKFLPFLPPGGSKDHGRRNVIICDELDKAKDELQNPLLELLQFHTMNGSPIDVQSFVLTGNLPDEGAFSRPISHALTNRCQVYQLKHNVTAWLNWAIDNHINPLVVGFLSRNPHLLSQPPVSGDPTAYNRPSPRSWSMTARDLDVSLNETGYLASSDFQVQLVMGRVGIPAALQFKVWLDHYRVLAPIVNDLCKEGKRPPKTMESDKTIVCAISACSEVFKFCRKEVSDKAKHKAQLKKMVENVFSWILTLTPDFQIAAVKTNFAVKEIKEHGLADFPLFTEAFTKVHIAQNTLT